MLKLIEGLKVFKTFNYVSGHRLGCLKICKFQTKVLVQGCNVSRQPLKVSIRITSNDYIMPIFQLNFET